MRLLQTALVVSFGLFAPFAARAASICPAFGYATAGCDLTITVTDSGTTVAAGPSFGIAGGTYDGSDDTLVGIVNNSSSPLGSINLSSNTDIFGFDGDGIDTYSAPGNASDTSGYGGPDSFFTNISYDAYDGTVNFLTPLGAGGGNTYFSLEEALVPNQVVVGPIGSSVTPEPDTLILLATGLLGFAGIVRRRLVT